MKLVQFKDESYGVRRGGWWSFGYQYLDLSESANKWCIRESMIKRYCKTSNRTHAEKRILHYKDKGRPLSLTDPNVRA